MSDSPGAEGAAWVQWSSLSQGVIVTLSQSGQVTFASDSFWTSIRLPRPSAEASISFNSLVLQEDLDDTARVLRRLCNGSVQKVAFENRLSRASGFGSDCIGYRWYGVRNDSNQPESIHLAGFPESMVSRMSEYDTIFQATARTYASADEACQAHLAAGCSLLKLSGGFVARFLHKDRSSGFGGLNQRPPRSLSSQVSDQTIREESGSSSSSRNSTAAGASMNAAIYNTLSVPSHPNQTPAEVSAACLDSIQNLGDQVPEGTLSPLAPAHAVSSPANPFVYTRTTSDVDSLGALSSALPTASLVQPSSPPSALKVVCCRSDSLPSLDNASAFSLSDSESAQSIASSSISSRLAPVSVARGKYSVSDFPGACHILQCTAAAMSRPEPPVQSLVNQPVVLDPSHSSPRTTVSTASAEFSKAPTVHDADIMNRGDRERLCQPASSPLQVTLPVYCNGGLWGMMDFYCSEINGSPDGCDFRRKELLRYLSKSLGLHLAFHSAEAKRVKAEEEMDCIFGLCMDILCLCTPEGRFLKVNPAFTSTLGYSMEEALNFDYYEMMHPDDVAGSRAALQQVHQSPIHQFRNRFRTKSGEYKWIAWNTVAVGKLNWCVATGRDVTLETEREMHLETARRLAETAAQAKSEFLANMSHEIRTPMNGVKGMAALLQQTALTSEQAEYVKNILVSGEHLLAVINDILDLSKIDSGKTELECQPVDVYETVEQAIDLAFRPEFAALSISYAIHPQVPSHIMGDGTRLRQVLTNLVANAFKFTKPPEEVSVSVKLESRSNDLCTIIFSCRDTGAGIKKEMQSKLFKPFSQVYGALNREYGGTGLGLAISSRLVAAMHGEISVESEEGRGSTFSFSIKAHVAPAREQTRAFPIPASITENKRVLLLHGSSFIRAASTEVLTSWGLTVFATSSVAETIAALENGATFQFALIDAELLPDTVPAMAVPEDLDDRDFSSEASTPLSTASAAQEMTVGLEQTSLSSPAYAYHGLGSPTPSIHSLTAPPALSLGTCGAEVSTPVSGLSVLLGSERVRSPGRSHSRSVSPANVPRAKERPKSPKPIGAAPPVAISAKSSRAIVTHSALGHSGSIFSPSAVKPRSAINLSQMAAESDSQLSGSRLSPFKPLMSSHDTDRSDTFVRCVSAPQLTSQSSAEVPSATSPGPQSLSPSLGMTHLRRNSSANAATLPLTGHRGSLLERAPIRLSSSSRSSSPALRMRNLQQQSAFALGHAGTLSTSALPSAASNPAVSSGVSSSAMGFSERMRTSAKRIHSAHEQLRLTNIQNMTQESRAMQEFGTIGSDYAEEVITPASSDSSLSLSSLEGNRQYELYGRDMEKVVRYLLPHTGKHGIVLLAPLASAPVIGSSWRQSHWFRAMKCIHATFAPDLLRIPVKWTQVYQRIQTLWSKSPATSLPPSDLSLVPSLSEAASSIALSRVPGLFPSSASVASASPREAQTLASSFISSGSGSSRPSATAVSTEAVPALEGTASSSLAAKESSAENPSKPQPPASRSQILDQSLGQTIPVSILVAEDQPINRRLIMRVLEKLGYRDVPYAGDGLQAVKMCRQKHYDLILMDVQMPALDGLAATRAIRELYASLGTKRPRQPFIVAMTANAMRGDKEQCLAAGMDDYLSKPIDFSEVSEKIYFWGSKALSPSPSLLSIGAISQQL